MKKIKLLKTLLIPTIGITTIGTIATVLTSCGSKNSEDPDEKQDSYVILTANADSTLELRNERENNPNLQYSSNGKN